MAHGQKLMVLLLPYGEMPYGLLSTSYFYCPNLKTVAPVARG